MSRCLALYGLSSRFQRRSSLTKFTTSKYGDQLTLEDALGQTQDEVNYKLGFPWPTVGDPAGNSIELIHPSLDHNLGGSWRSRLPTPGRRNSAYATNAP